jgi:hypothetical protein
MRRVLSILWATVGMRFVLDPAFSQDDKRSHVAVVAIGLILLAAGVQLERSRSRWPLWTLLLGSLVLTAAALRSAMMAWTVSVLDASSPVVPLFVIGAIAFVSLGSAMVLLRLLRYRGNSGSDLA